MENILFIEIAFGFSKKKNLKNFEKSSLLFYKPNILSIKTKKIIREKIRIFSRILSLRFFYDLD
jgi:hypothetical protein